MQGVRLDLVRRKKRIERTRANSSTRPGMRVIDAADAVVRARVEGEGPKTVVLVPDPPNVIEHYDALFDALGGDLRIACFELPGFGFSVPPPRFRFSLEDHADVAAAVLRAMGVSQALWAACCLPAFVGLTVAQRHPGVLSALVCGQAPSWEDELRWARRLDPRGRLTTPVVGQVLSMVMKRRIADGWYGVAASDESRIWLQEICGSALDRGAAYPLASTLQASLSHGEVGRVTDLPVTFVWGLLDRTHGKSDPESASQNAAECEIVTFEQSAHFPDLEEPERFAKVVRQRAGSL